MMQKKTIFVITGIILLLFSQAYLGFPLSTTTLSQEDFELQKVSSVALPFDLSLTYGGATATRWGHKTWIINDIHYVFFAQKGSCYYSKSENGSYWSQPTYVTSGVYDYGEVFTTDYHDGVLGLMVKNVDTLNFKKGVFLEDGNIAFGETQEAYHPRLLQEDPGVGGGFADHYFIFDSNGYPWLSWTYHLNTGETNLVVSKSSKVGEWETQTGFPVRLTNFYWTDKLQRLPEGRIYVFYGSNGRLFNGLSWENEQPVSSKPQINTYLGETWSYDVVTDKNGDMHLVYISYEGELRYSFYNHITKTWSYDFEQVLATGLQSSSAGKLVYDKKNDVIYCFWSPTGQAEKYASPNSQLHYKMFINQQWTETYEIADETLNGGISRGDAVNVTPETVNGQIGVVYPLGEGTKLRYLLLKQQNTDQDIIPPIPENFLLAAVAGVAIAGVAVLLKKREAKSK